MELLAESRHVYRMSHKVDEIEIRMDLMVPSSAITAQRDHMDITEDLSHFPHRNRREFAEKIHTYYQGTRCVQEIAQQMQDDQYYCHLCKLGYKIASLMLSYDARAKLFSYCLILVQ